MPSEVFLLFLFYSLFLGEKGMLCQHKEATLPATDRDAALCRGAAAVWIPAPLPARRGCWAGLAETYPVMAILPQGIWLELFKGPHLSVH